MRVHAPLETQFGSGRNTSASLILKDFRSLAFDKVQLAVLDGTPWEDALQHFWSVSFTQLLAPDSCRKTYQPSSYLKEESKSWLSQTALEMFGSNFFFSQLLSTSLFWILPCVSFSSQPRVGVSGLDFTSLAKEHSCRPQQPKLYYDKAKGVFTSISGEKKKKKSGKECKL